MLNFLQSIAKFKHQEIRPTDALVIVTRLTGTCHINAIYLSHETRGNGPETPRGHKAHEYG